MRIYGNPWHPPPHFDPEAPKEPTNVSINQDLVRAAKAHRLNVSRIAEVALAEAVREKAWQAWIEDNAEAVERYNADPYPRDVQRRPAALLMAQFDIHNNTRPSASTRSSRRPIS